MTTIPTDGAEHEHLFPEEQEPSGRLILAPCMVCEVTAMDALHQVRVERDRARRDMQMWSMSATDYLRLLLPMMTARQKEAFESTGELPDALGTTIPTPDLTERARAEAERRYGRPDSRVTNFGAQASASSIEGFVAGAAWAAQQSAAAEGVQPGRTGADDCPAPAHLHGCYADLNGRCSEPEEHRTPAAAEDVLAHAAIGRAADAIRGTGSSVQIDGLRIEECDIYGATATTRARDAALAAAERVSVSAEAVERAFEQHLAAVEPYSADIDAAHAFLKALGIEVRDV